MGNKTNPEALTLDDLKALMARLRGEDGCPWDRKQTPQSLKIYLLEEAYELAEALDKMDLPEIKEELGDLLFQIVFFCRVFEEQGVFNLDQVIRTIYQKMIRRHPHIFGNENWESPEQVSQGWQDIKALEKRGQDPFESIPVSEPSLLKAHRISQRAAGLGFDWPHIEGVLGKVEEEIEELKRAIQENDRQAAGEELGDLLFALVNVGRFLRIPAENALRQANHKFLRRFRRMAEEPRFQEKEVSPLSLEEWDELWVRSKEGI
jgi:MazG family protein